MKRAALIGASLALALLGCPEVAPPPARPAPLASASAAPTVSASAPAPAPAPPPPPAPVKRAGQRIQLVEKAMGTRVVLAAYTTPTHDAAAVRKALGDALVEIRRLETLMTTWQPDSEVSRINAAAGKSAVKVGPETFEVIDRSLWIANLSEGTFDITFASMGKLWRFDHDKVEEVPNKRALAKARKLIDFRNIKVDDRARTVKLTKSTTKINLGGIAKGYAIDRAAAVLKKAGLPAFYTQAGGDLYVRGKKPDGSAWKVGVRDPRGPDGSFFALLPIEDHAFSTAGDYERAFIKDGKRYHHIIDPRTGYPATACRQVTVWADDALTADAIDDAVFILGVKKGLALVEKIDGAGAVIVDRDNVVHVSSRLKGVVQQLRPPSDGI